MYAPIRKSGHTIWREWWYAFTLRISLQINLYTNQKDQVFIADVVITDLM
jgi:hypothetical protein